MHRSWNGCSASSKASVCAARPVRILRPLENPSAGLPEKSAKANPLRDRVKAKARGRVKAREGKAEAVKVREPAEARDKEKAKVRDRAKVKARVRAMAAVVVAVKAVSRQAPAVLFRCAAIQHLSKPNSTESRCPFGPLEVHVLRRSRKPASANAPSWTTVM